ncbi:uncharacterized protein LOC119969067 isoform X1 [Scyliorhinus canicula]|uniref:uncharacterized protein LOC119969067 isoform X1 n=1 Tax=Scyliorhinus canicula TaxID=7830 RepID=UPI0018F7922E|nr:uncharacterized protein LOC119969067 isoform X1 [Scyliorhinus canicula]
MSNQAEATEMGVTQDSHMALLRALLAEKDEDLNQLNKELKKLQLTNKQLLEEQCLVMSTNKRLQMETARAVEDKVKGDTSDTNTTAAAVLQKRIEDLKSYLKDLQEANDSAVNELTKADEEISQLRGKITKLRSKHAEELQDAKEESDYLKDKINRLHSDPTRHILEDNTFGLLDEIQQLRNESRKLREANHRLDEENRQLKEALWDFKQQRGWLSKKSLKKTNVEAIKRGGGAISAQKVEQPKKKQEPVLQSIPSQLQGPSPSSQLRFEYFNVEEKNSPTKSREGVTFDQRLPTWDEEDKNRATSNASPVSVDSDSTEVLLASCHNGTFNKASKSNKHHRGGSLFDLDGGSDDDMSSISQSNGHHQFPKTQYSSSTPCKSTPSSPVFLSIYSNRKKSMRSIDKAVLPRRPFAPRDIADLKIGHLIKFSRPAGKISKGVIKYLGHLPGRQEAYVGTELEGDEVGRHNGTFEGVRYFTCKLNKGVFVNFNKVIMAWE